MELEKIRSLSDEQLTVEVKQAAEQMFRLRFQLSLGQNDGVKKIRELRKQVARMKTIVRERQLEGAVAGAAQAGTTKGAR